MVTKGGVKTPVSSISLQYKTRKADMPIFLLFHYFIARVPAVVELHSLSSRSLWQLNMQLPLFLRQSVITLLTGVKNITELENLLLWIDCCITRVRLLPFPLFQLLFKFWQRLFKKMNNDFRKSLSSPKRNIGDF